MNMKLTFGIAALTTIVASAPAIVDELPMTALRPDQTAYLAINKELVETNTTLSAGICTLAA